MYNYNFEIYNYSIFINYELILLVSRLQKTPMLTKTYKILNHAKHLDIKNKDQTEQSTNKDCLLNQGIHCNSYLFT